MTELLILTFLLMIWTYILRIIRRFNPGAAPGSAYWAMRTFLRRKLFSAEKSLVLAEVHPGSHVLEIGPGWGYLTKQLAELVGETGELLVVDIDEKMVRECREAMPDTYGSLHCVQADGIALPFVTQSFDLIVLVGVAGEISDREQLFIEVERCLAPGGKVIVSEIILHPEYTSRQDVIRNGEAAGLIHELSKGNFAHHTSRFIKPGKTS